MMLKTILNILLFSFFFLLATPIKAQSEQKYIVEGAVVAYQKVNRCPACEGSNGGIGIQIENWVVRIDNWLDKNSPQDKYILVKYQMYSRSLSESEINKWLRFNLRNLFEYEKYTDCIGNITYKKGSDYFLRVAKFSDYVLTQQAKSEDIPTELKNLPCFVVDKTPFVLK